MTHISLEMISFAEGFVNIILSFPFLKLGTWTIDGNTLRIKALIQSVDTFLADKYPRVCNL